jgi:hypothetical protein
MSADSGQEEPGPRFWLSIEVPDDAIWTSPTSFIWVPKSLCADCGDPEDRHEAVCRDCGCKRFVRTPAPTEPPDWTGWQEVGYTDET